MNIIQYSLSSSLSTNSLGEKKISLAAKSRFKNQESIVILQHKII